MTARRLTREPSYALHVASAPGTIAADESSSPAAMADRSPAAARAKMVDVSTMAK